ncbi:MAG: hypothetical protein K6U87_15310, partial [Firmicutes bacterium]|nr:hypothetical protein [Bacillota bacterium]
AVRWRRGGRGGGMRAAPHDQAAADARPALARPWVAWVWGTQRHAGATTVAVALARWLAWWQRTPVVLLDGHPEHPGLKAVLRGDLPWPGMGWEGTWQAGVPWTPPPQVVDLGPGLRAWALGRPLRLPGLDRWWPDVLRHLAAEALVVVDGGLRPPPVAVALPICVVGGLGARPVAPQGTWFARRRGDGLPRCLVVPSEPLGADGVGSAAWLACWDPLAEALGAQASAQGS